MAKFGGHGRVNKADGSSADHWLSYTCWSCGHQVSGAVVGRPSSQEYGSDDLRWLWCPECAEPAVRSTDQTIRPGARFGPQVPGLDREVQRAYDEARDCMSVGAYTGAELLCRKILMYVAVDKGLSAKDGKGRAPSFAACIDHLAEEGFVTPPMRPWVDRIRAHGNDATHELDPPTENRAKSTVLFTAQMLNNTYGMDHLAGVYAGDDKGQRGDGGGATGD